MADNKILNDEEIGDLSGGLAVKEALASPVFKDELLKRLPAGTILDEATLAKLAGGFGQLAGSVKGGLASGLASGLADSLAAKKNASDILAGGLAKDLAMPDMFASPADMVVWLENKLKGGIKTDRAEAEMIKIAKKT